MKRWLISSLVLLPRLVWAADLGPFADLGPIGTGIIALGYLFGAGTVVWCGGHVVAAYNNRDIEGMGGVFKWTGLTLVGAILLSVVVPRFVAPIVALGATW